MISWNVPFVKETVIYINILSINHIFDLGFRLVPKV